MICLIFYLLPLVQDPVLPFLCLVQLQCQLETQRPFLFQHDNNHIPLTGQLRPKNREPQTNNYCSSFTIIDFRILAFTHTLFLWYGIGDLTNKLILRGSFQPCWQSFANWSYQKLENLSGGTEKKLWDFQNAQTVSLQNSCYIEGEVCCSTEQLLNLCTCTPLVPLLTSNYFPVLPIHVPRQHLYLIFSFSY